MWRKIASVSNCWVIIFSKKCISVTIKNTLNFKFIKGSCLCQRNILNLTNAQTVFANFLPSSFFLLRQHDHFLYLEVCAMKCIHCREETLKIQLKKGTTLLSASKVTANSNINSITRIVMLLTQNKKKYPRRPSCSYDYRN